jgi:hypothetical protein
MARGLSMDEILRTWEFHHGRLSAQLKDQFYNRRELDELILLPRGAVKTAVREQKKLVDILATAKSITAAQQAIPPPPPKRPKSPGRQSTTPKQAKAPQRRPTSRGASSLAGPSGTVSPYGVTGTVRNPGAAEMAIGERCSNCGAFVPSGAVHDCR